MKERLFRVDTMQVTMPCEKQDCYGFMEATGREKLLPAIRKDIQAMCPVNLHFEHKCTECERTAFYIKSYPYMQYDPIPPGIDRHL